MGFNRWRNRNSFVCFCGVFLFTIFPLFYITRISGLDLFVLLLDPYSLGSNVPLYIGIVLFSLIGCLVGIYMDKNISKTKKVVIFLVVFVFFSPLGIHNHLLRNNDQKIIDEKMIRKTNKSKSFYEDGYISVLAEYYSVPSKEICKELSVFASVDKIEDCFEGVAIENKDSEVCNIFFEQGEFLKEIDIKDEWFCRFPFIDCDEFQRRKFFNFSYAESQIENCFTGVALVSDKIEICELIKHQSGRDFCFLSFAREKDSIEACNLMTRFENGKCFSFFAQEKKDVSICEKIVDIRTRQVCYLDVFREIKDFSICEKITDSKLKSKCEQ